MKPSVESLQAIETAIQIEKDGLEFYTTAAGQTTDPSGKKMFQSLARDEAVHLKLFEAVRESLLKDGTWLSPEQVAAIGPQRLARPPVFPTKEEIKAVQVPERELAALQRGIQAEEDSISFYSGARDKTDDPDGKALYSYLIEQEEGHRTILQGEYDYLTNTGFWFDIREFDLEAIS
ncbi:MAG: ferritin family protein [Anaerolineae bacterium]|jgi:rubrerythrin|nr:ferritin family protein [Anaerolineae bacterium]MDH7475563.1 ferritin family protein [Anaerolineae bacterium]